MHIIIDGNKVPVNPRTSKDILITLRSIANSMRWSLTYDTTKETVHINTKGSKAFFAVGERPTNEENESSRLAGKIICIDPGHGGSDPGAIGPTGTCEKDNTLAVSLLLCDKLFKNGATVILTRDADTDVFGPFASINEELGARVDIANNNQADIFISLHNDAFTTPMASGTTSFHYGTPEGQRLAAGIQKSLVENLGTKDRGSRFGSLYVIRYVNMPAALVEVAFISNPEEEVLLSSVDGRCKIADSVFEGIVKYFRV